MNTTFSLLIACYMIAGETPLYEATMQCHVGTVKYLLTNKANHNVKSRLGVTTLHHAATKGKTGARCISIWHKFHDS